MARPALPLPFTVALLCSAMWAADAPSQVSLTLDGTLSSRYVWRGLTRANRWVAQPEAYVTLNVADGFLSAGQWLSYQLGAAGPGQLSDLGPGVSGLAELNRWAQYARRAGPVDFSLGFIRYQYRGTVSGSGRTSASNTSEVYATLRASSKYLAPGVSVYHDVDRVKGAYLEAYGAVPVFGSPLHKPAFWIIVGGLAGYSLGQEVHRGDTAQAANFARSGLTHVDWSFTFGLPRVLGEGIAWQFEGHVQFNHDALTRRTSAAPADADRSVRLFLKTSLQWSAPVLKW